MRLACVLVAVVTLVMAAVAPAGAAGGSSSGRAQAADTMVERINQVRARHGLRPLRASTSLDETATRFAAHLMRVDALHHRARPSASRRYRYAGEVLALHSGRGYQVASTIGRWLHSSTHRAVLLSRSMSEMGAGVSYGRFRGREAVIWVVQVGRR